MNPVQATMTDSPPGPFAGRVPGTGAAPFDSAVDRWTDASRADPIAASAAPLAPPLPSQAPVQTMADQAPVWQQLGDLPLRLPEALVAQLAVEWQARPGSMLLAAALAVLVLVLSVFALRQALFACNRWLAPVRYPYPDLQAAVWLACAGATAALHQQWARRAHSQQHQDLARGLASWWLDCEQAGPASESLVWSETVLLAWLGCLPSVLSRALHVLREQGALERAAQGWRCADRGRLSALAGDPTDRGDLSAPPRRPAPALRPP